MKEVVANNFDELLGHALSIDDFAVYRGVSKFTYQLIPKLGRADKAELAKFGSGKLRDLEKTIIGQFKAESQAYLDRLPVNDWEWLCLMQHHGSPTRLMDWTLSPLAGAFFALRFARNKGYDPKPAALYGLPCAESLTTFTNTNPMTHTTIEFIKPPHISNRIVAQQSYLSFHPDAEKPFDSEKLLKIVIPIEAQQEIAYKVDRLGFREATMFPGLDSINDGIRKGFGI